MGEGKSSRLNVSLSKNSFISARDSLSTISEYWIFCFLNPLYFFFCWSFEVALFLLSGSSCQTVRLLVWRMGRGHGQGQRAFLPKVGHHVTLQSSWFAEILKLKEKVSSKTLLAGWYRVWPTSWCHTRENRLMGFRGDKSELWRNDQTLTLLSNLLLLFLPCGHAKTLLVVFDLNVFWLNIVIRK